MEPTGKLVVTFIAAITVWSLVPSAPAGSAQAPDVALPSPDAGCSSHPPIQITENAGQEGFVLVEGTPTYRAGSGVVAGQGTPGSPYVISGWCIDGNETLLPTSGEASHGLVIQNTDAHVVVENLSVENHTADGIVLQDAENVTITDTTVQSNAGNGLVADAVRDVEVQATTILANGGSGIQLEEGERARFTDTLILDNGREGIAAQGSEELTLASNRIVANADHCVHLDRTDDAQIVDNEVEDCTSGIRVAGTDAPTIDGNEVVDHDGVGIQVSDSSSPWIADNSIERNDPRGLRLIGVEEPTIVNNTIADNALRGARVQGASDALFSNNTFEANFVRDLFVQGSSSVDVLDNTFTGGNGLLIHDSQALLVAGNVLTDVGTLKVQSSTDASIEGNLIQDGKHTGITAISVSAASISSNTIDAAKFRGLMLQGLEQATVTQNEVTNNRVGFDVRNGEDLSIHQNDIQDNWYRGLVARDQSEPLPLEDNWWGASDGPSGGVEDACTVEVADGNGDRIATDGSPVCFDPWLPEPVSQAGAG